jgi:hypothetical protein
MDSDCGEPSTKCDCRDHDVTQQDAQMSVEMLALLRHRVATRYYDQPQVIDRIARAICRNHETRVS